MRYSRRNPTEVEQEFKKAKKQLKALRDAVHSLYAFHRITREEAVLLQTRIDELQRRNEEAERLCVGRWPGAGPGPTVGSPSLGGAAAATASVEEDVTARAFGSKYWLARFKLPKDMQRKGESEFGWFMLRTPASMNEFSLVQALQAKHGLPFKVYIVEDDQHAWYVYPKGNKKMATMVAARTKDKAIEKALKRNNMGLYNRALFTAEWKSYNHFSDI